MSTFRKQKIAAAAEQLFAERGYDGASTHLIAKQAGVSEALIFKHFGSKEALLEAVIKGGYRRIVSAMRGLVVEDGDVLAFVHRLVDLPAQLVREEPKFWEMQYRLIDLPMSVSEHRRFLQPVEAQLTKAFRELGYRAPAQETQLLMLIIDALWKHEVVQGRGSTKFISELMKEKYKASSPQTLAAV